MSITNSRLWAASAAIALVVALGARDSAARDYSGSRLNFGFSAFDGTGFSPTPTAGQLNSATWQVSGLSTGEVIFRGTGTTGDAARGLSSGRVFTGGIYAFQVSSDTRALGFQPTSDVLTPGEIVLRLVNATGRTPDSVSVSWTVWARNDADRSTSVTAQWSTDGETWTTMTGGTFTTPETADAVPGWASRQFGATIDSVAWEDEGILKIRWLTDDAGGAGDRDELGISEISFWESECGDAVLDPGEECEPLIDGRSVCDNDCTFAMCGDGTPNGPAGEECDEPGGATCDDDCSIAACGDGLANVAAGESCDAGSTVALGSLAASNSNGSVSGNSLDRAQVFQVTEAVHVTAVELVMSSTVPSGCEGATVSIINTVAATAAPNRDSVRGTSTGYVSGTATSGWSHVWIPFDVNLAAGRYAILWDSAGVRANCLLRSGSNNPHVGGRIWTTTTADSDVLEDVYPTGTDLDFAIRSNDFGVTCNDDCTPAVCGDLVVNEAAGEFCDQGRTTATCDGDCTGVECGDGYRNLTAGEDCDTGGDSETCDLDCTAARCGDLYVNEAAGESCEDGNLEVGDGCDDSCVAEECGNGVAQVGEDCDSGGEDSETCNADCTDAVCGDSYVNAASGELCDEGGDSVDCDGDCTAPSCGDGYANAVIGEDCDTRGDDTEDCNADCTAVACGDGYTNTVAGEQCDDGNTRSNDGCSSSCLSEECGDGALNRDLGEQCDDGNTDSGDGCDANCFFETCGNGEVQDGEECDDGGETAECDSDCTEVSCGDGQVNITVGEECDDGNTTDGDGCTSTCGREECGDGIVQPGIGEACDDGNRTDGDGCESNCTLPGGDAGPDAGMDAGPDAGTGDGDRPSGGGKRGCTASDATTPSATVLLLLLGLAVARRRPSRR